VPEDRGKTPPFPTPGEKPALANSFLAIRPFRKFHRSGRYGGKRRRGSRPPPLPTQPSDAQPKGVAGMFNAPHGAAQVERAKKVEDEGASASRPRAPASVGNFHFSQVGDMVFTGMFSLFPHPYRFPVAFTADGHPMTGNRCVNFLIGSRFGEGGGWGARWCSPERELTRWRGENTCPGKGLPGESPPQRELGGEREQPLAEGPIVFGKAKNRDLQVRDKSSRLKLLHLPAGGVKELGGELPQGRRVFPNQRSHESPTGRPRAREGQKRDRRVAGGNGREWVTPQPRSRPPIATPSLHA
jgi:hypothetical protein